MKKIFYLLSLLTATVLVSCSSVDDYDCADSSETSLSYVLGEIVEKSDPQNGTVYVSYDDASGAKIAPMTRSSSNDNAGWIHAGRVKSRANAVLFAMKLANKLEKGRIVQLRIVPLENGNGWDVYYRYED